MVAHTLKAYEIEYEAMPNFDVRVTYNGGRIEEKILATLKPRSV